MKRLSGMDAFFVSTESPTWHMHTAGLVVIDPATAPGFGYERLRDQLASRVQLVPQFKRRLKEVPLGLDRPIWVDDPDFDVSWHLHRVAVPSPGGPRQLGELIGDLLEHQLDRRRPLWEVWFIEGLEGDRVAFLAKTHHALVDGVSGAGLAEILCDLDPNPAPRDVPDKAEPVERDRSDLELVTRGLASIVASPPRVARFLLQTAQQAGTLLSHLRQPQGPPALLSAPRTSFNGALGPLRQFTYCSVPLDDVKRVKKHFDVKVNDVVLALVAGAVRRYLVARDELPSSPLLATVPISTRTSEHEGALGNVLRTMVTSLATEVEDPVERLMAIHYSTRSAKEMAQALQAKRIMGVTDVTPPGLVNLAFRAFHLTGMERRGPLQTNVTVSNVPGPPFPLYVAGARIEHMFPIGPLTTGMGLNATVMSYLDSMDFGLQVDPQLVADPWQLINGVASELGELMTAGRIESQGS